MFFSCLTVAGKGFVNTPVHLLVCVCVCVWFVHNVKTREAPGTLCNLKHKNIWYLGTRTGMY